MTDMDCMDEGDDFANLIVLCRECGKLLKAEGCQQDGEWQAFSSGAPIFGKCPSPKRWPGCREKIAAVVVAVENRP